MEHKIQWPLSISQHILLFCCKVIYFFTEMHKLKAFKNLFKIFMEIFEHLDSLKIKRLQRSSYKNFLNISRKLKPILSHLIKDGKYLPQKRYQGAIVIESKQPQVKGNNIIFTFCIIFSGCQWAFLPGNFLKQFFPTSA